MHNDLSSAYLHKLSLLSPASFQQVTLYLNLLQARNYARGTLIVVIGAVRRLLFYLPEPRRSAVALNLADTTSHDIDLFIAATRKHGLCASTINNTLSLLTEFFDHLREDGQMHIQPIIRRRHRLCAPLRLPKPMREDDLVKFFKVIDSIRDRLIFLLMLRCGLRVSEVSSLTWADIDLSSGTLRVNNTKGLVDRIGYLASDVERSLKLWHARCPSEQYLFPAQQARCGQQSVTLSGQQIFRLMKQYLRQAEISDHYSPHSLRHSFATQMINAGVTLEVLKELMGHRSIQMTLCYTQLYDSTKRRQFTQAMHCIEERQAGLGGKSHVVAG